jgi:hypothetical protein|tara:strand:- start:2830 stop:2964 length:135 start_codon:yes stop_codon:yes gene_type:complete
MAKYALRSSSRGAEGYVGLLRLADVMVLVKWPDELVSAKNGEEG